MGKCLVLILVVLSFTACGNGENVDYNEKYIQLQNTIDSQQVKITELQNRLDTLELMLVNSLPKSKRKIYNKNNLTTSPDENNLTYVSHNTKAKRVAVRCKGYNKKGNRCKRMTTDASGYCWQHD